MQRIRTISYLFLFSLSLEVYGFNGTAGCPVVAGYFPGNDTVISNNSPLFFENRSSGAGFFSWFMNGLFVSSQKDFTLVPSPGVNEIMLVSTNGNCSDTSFSYVIWDGAVAGMNANFQKQYNPGGMSMEPFCMAADGGDGYLLAGDFYQPQNSNFISKTTCLLRIDQKGCVTWGKSMVAGELEVIQSIISVSDSGWLVSAFPYQAQQNNYPEFLIVFKLDKSGNTEWSHSYSNGSAVNNYYSAICETGDRGFALEIGSFPVSGNPSFISVIKIDQSGQFVWGRQLSAESNAFYNVGGITEKNQSLFATGSLYDATAPFDLIRSFLVELKESNGTTVRSDQNDPVQSPLTFTDIHPYKDGLLINSYSGNGINQFLFADLNGNISGSLLVNNPYGSLNGKGNIVVAADNGIYFQQSSGSLVSGYKDIIMHLDSNLQIRWQYDFSAKDLNYTGWFQLSGAPDFGVSGIGSGLLPNGLQTMDFMKLDSSGAGCHSDETDLQLITDTALLLPLNWNTDIGFSMQVRDLPMSLDNIDIESHLYCPRFMNGCDLLKLEGSTGVCQSGDTIRFQLHNDPYCSGPVIWNYDRESVTTIDSNQAARVLRFEKTGEYIIKVEKSGCNDLADSMIVLVGSQIAKINLPPDTVLCIGSVMTLDPGIGFAEYLWQDGTTSESLQVQGIGQYRVQLTEKNGCVSSDTTTIRSVEPLPVSFLPSDTVICSGDPWEAGPAHPFRSYVWNTGDTSGSIQISNAGTYILQVVDEHGCMGTDSIRVETKKCPFGIFFPNAFTPNQDGLNDIFKPVITGRPSVYKLVIYNRWGQQVFETTDPGAGWNGRIENIEQETGTYIWTCIYQFNTQEKMIKKGSVILLR